MEFGKPVAESSPQEAVLDEGADNAVESVAIGDALVTVTVDRGARMSTVSIAINNEPGLTGSATAVAKLRVPVTSSGLEITITRKQV